MPITERELKGLMGAISTILKEELSRRAAEIKSLADRLAALESRPKGLDYHGVHADGERYSLNDCVTRSGGLWICTVASTTDTPGTSTAWQLAVKRGSAQ